MPATIVASADITREGSGRRSIQTKNSSGTLTDTAHEPTGERPSLTGAATVFGCIETTNSALFVESIAGKSNVIATETDNPAATPDLDVNHFLRLIVQKPSSGGQNVAVTLQLRQGYTAETAAALGTFIASIEAVLSDTGVVAYRHRLTVTEAARITSYTDLQFRFLLSSIKGGAPRAVRVIHASLEVSQPGDRSTDIKQTPQELARFGASDLVGVQHAG